MGPLSPAQLREFAAEGVLILPGFIDDATSAGWLAQLEEQLGSDPLSAATWANGGSNTKALVPTLSDVPQMAALLDQLGGSGWTGGGAGLGAVKVMQEPTRQHPPAPPGAPYGTQMNHARPMGHIDGYGPGGWTGGFILAATTYLADVEAGGGAFVYWPRSHRAINRFFQQYPETLDGSFRILPTFWGEPAGANNGAAPTSPASRQWDVMYGDDRETSIAVGECTEFVGKRGDLILWHSFMVHTGSANVASSSPRLGVFGRWHRAEARRPAGPIRGFDNAGNSRADAGPEYHDFEPLDSLARQEPWYEVPTNMWEHWSDEMKEAAAGLVAADDAEAEALQRGASVRNGSALRETLDELSCRAAFAAKL